MRDLLFAKQIAHPVVISKHSDYIVSQLSQAVVSAIRTSHPRRDLLPHMLGDLAGWKRRPHSLTMMAYELCSAISENHSSLADGRRLLFLSLQIGFRHLDPQDPRIPVELAHTSFHPWMVDIVFESGDDEVIADFLHAWTSHGDSHEPSPSLGLCAGHLIGLRPSSRRLRRLVIRAVELIGPWEFEVGEGEFFRLLNHLRVGVEDMDKEDPWVTLLTHVIQHPEGVRNLPHPYWELLVELSLSGSLQHGSIAWDPDIMTSLEGDQEWGKLECWTSIAWMLWPPEAGITTEADLGGVTLSLFRRRPDAILKLGRLAERWSEERCEGVPESFRRICDQASQTGPQVGSEL